MGFKLGESIWPPVDRASNTPGGNRCRFVLSIKGVCGIKLVRRRLDDPTFLCRKLGFGLHPWLVKAGFSRLCRQINHQSLPRCDPAVPLMLTSSTWTFLGLCSQNCETLYSWHSIIKMTVCINWKMAVMRGRCFLLFRKKHAWSSVWIIFATCKGARRRLRSKLNHHHHSLLYPCLRIIGLGSGFYSWYVALPQQARPGMQQQSIWTQHIKVRPRRRRGLGRGSAVVAVECIRQDSHSTTTFVASHSS